MTEALKMSRRNFGEETMSPTWRKVNKQKTYLISANPTS